MQAADTNVWTRAYLNDDARQAQQARKAIAAACAADGIFVPLLVLAELFWVLTGAWEKERVLDTLEHIFSTDGVIVESNALAERALKESRVGGAGLCRPSDCRGRFCRRRARDPHLRQSLCPPAACAPAAQLKIKT